MIHLTKNRSPRRIEIVEDSEDGWFLRVNKIENKSGKKVESNMIIKKDLETWIRHLEEMGWLKKT